VKASSAAEATNAVKTIILRIAIILFIFYLSSHPY
jgi:hypothetical protein